METPEGNTYDSPEDDLWFQIRWRLFNQSELQRMRVADIGEENIMPDDRFLTDFSLAWKGEPDTDAPRWWYEEMQAYREQEQKAATSTTIGNGTCRVTSSDASDRIQIWGIGDGPSTILLADLPELIPVLQKLTQKSRPLTDGEKVALYYQRKQR